MSDNDIGCVCRRMTWDVYVGELHGMCMSENCMGCVSRRIAWDVGESHGMCMSERNGDYKGKCLRKARSLTIVSQGGVLWLRGHIVTCGVLIKSM